MYKRPSNQYQGFTLIEIMVVLFIFMMVLTMIAINTDFSITSQKRVENEAENIFAKIRIARQTAIFQHIPIRLTIEHKSYGFQKYIGNQKGTNWEWISNDSLLQAQEIRNGWVFRLIGTIELYPNGRMSPFQLSIIDPKNKVHISIVGKSTGEMEITQG